MAVSVVEVAIANFDGATSAAPSLTATPQAGDVVAVVASLRFAATQLPHSFVINSSSLGATWVERANDTDGGNAAGSFRHLLWIGTGATTAGTINASWTNTGHGTVRAFLIRGLSSNVTATASSFMANVSQSGEFAGPVSQAQAGQAVIDLLAMDFANVSYSTLPSAYLPSMSSWATQLVYSSTAVGRVTTTYRVPAEVSATDHQTRETTGGFSHNSSRISQYVIGGTGGGAPSGITGSVAATGPTPSVSAAGTVVAGPITGSVAATGPTPSVSVMGAAGGVVAGVISATGPVPTVAVAGTVTASTLRPEKWTADLSQRALLQFAPQPGALIVTAPVAVAPAAIVEQPLTRQSHQMPAPTPDADGKVRSLGDYTIVDGAVGVPHIWVSGKDVTYFRDAPTTIGQWSSSQPGGDETAAVDFPQLTPFDVAGVGDLAWLKADAPVEIAIVREDGTRIPQFSGHLVSDNAGHTQTDLSNGWHVEGSLAQADYFGHRVPTMLDPTDIGTLISKHLNGVVSRRYGALPKVATGVMTRQRGAYGDTEWDYVQNLLGTAWTEGGNQWTIARTARARQYQVRLKDVTTEHWTLTAGAPGVEPDLTRDDSQRVDAIYGRGVGPDGFAWANWKYPNLLPDDAPAYPFNTAGAVISVGTTDAATNSGNGVSTWQERARELGYTLTVDGVFSSSDADTARAIQRRYGLAVDGVVGPQTWAASFAVGSNGGDLSGSYRAPLAIRTQVEPYLYAANGAVTGKNPNYDPSIIRHERDVDYGPGVTKAEAVASAQRELYRDSDPGWAGTITLATDPWQGSRWEMFEGQNVRLLGWRGQDLLLHIVEISKDPQSLTVSLTVDSKARDAMTLSSVLGRDRDAKADPARRPGNVNRRSRQEQDMAVEFDGESGAGVIPRMAVYSNLWSVIYIPVSQVGRIAKAYAQTSGPKAEFCLALFGKPIQPSHLVRLVGDPLAKADPFNQSESQAAALDDDFGFIEAFGGGDEPAGYWPKQKAGGTLTGRLVDTGGLEYVSARPPWVWVAIWSPSSTFISGRLLPAPLV